MAIVCAVLYYVTAEKLFVIAFTASLAEALADTASSGIGALSNKTYDVFRLKKCDTGLSGGMSLLGTLSGLAFSLLIALIPYAFGCVDLLDVLLISLFGFFGSIFDSLLGSLLQVKFKCKICGRIVEREVHCSTKAVRYSGIPLVTNNTVNFLSTLFSAVIALIIYA